MKKSIFVIILAAFMAMPMFMSSCKKAEPKPIALQLYSVRQNMDSSAVWTIEQVAKIGYKYVEAAGYKDGKFYGMDPVAFAELLKKNGIDFLSSHTGQPVPDSANWNKTMAWWDTCIAAHKAAGVKYIVQPFMDSVGYTSIAGVKRYCDYFNAVGEKCNAAGIKFGYHNHDREFKTIDSTVIYDYMLQNTDSSKVFFEMDLWWIYIGGGNALEYFAKYPGRFTLLHIKDEYEVGGSGKIDWKAIFDKANLAGAKYFVVEQEEYKTTALDGAKKSFDYLENADFVK